MITLWIGFVLFILLLLALDLGVFHKEEHVIGAKEALAWTALWVAVSLVFNVIVYFIYENHWFGMGLSAFHAKNGWDAALKYLTGYLVEKSLSLDNIFVIALIFSYFKIPPVHQHRVLFWGILGALVLRGLMIGIGAVLIQRFDWIIYVFGVLLILTAIRLFFSNEENVQPDRSLVVRWARRVYPVTDGLRGSHFFVQEGGRRATTPLFLALITVETSDLAFAVDSIPAIFAITQDPFIVFTSNVFAILGLRALYFALAALLGMFRYLKYSLVVLLAYIGVKMLLSHHHPIPTHVSLSLIAMILGVGCLASILLSRAEARPIPTSTKEE